MTAPNGIRGPLQQLAGDFGKRLQRALLAQETIVVCGMPLWECADCIEFLARSIPEERRVIVLQDRARFSGVRETELPKNHAILHYDTSDAGGASLGHVAEAALNLAGDHLMVPDLKDRDLDVFERQIADKFKGIIVGAGILVPGLYKGLRSIADVLIETAARNAAPPIGVRSVWARHTYPLEAIPAQGSGPHFAISAAGRICHAGSTIDAAGNDSRRIQQFLSLVRQSTDDLAALLNPNDNAFTELLRDLTRYRDAISHQESEIDWGLVWGLGVRLETSAAAAERRISGRLAPELEDAALAALQSLCVLHGPLILATAEGRELQDQADRLRMTREDQAALKADAVALSISLHQSEDTIIETDAAAIVEAAATGIGEGRHPERGTVFGIAGMKHVSTVLIGAAVVAAPRHFIDGILGDGLTLGAWEVMKRSPIFAAAVTAIGETCTRLLEAAGAGAQGLLVRLEPFPRFVRANEPLLRRIANTLQMRWLLTYLDIMEAEKSDHALPSSEEWRDRDR